jgi:hypothetical protein
MQDECLGMRSLGWRLGVPREVVEEWRWALDLSGGEGETTAGGMGGCLGERGMGFPWQSIDRRQVVDHLRRHGGVPPEVGDHLPGRS